MDTKFKIGDKVFCIEFNKCLGNWVCVGQFGILEVYKIIGINNVYATKVSNYSEQDCFTTLEEAEQECKKRNMEKLNEQVDNILMFIKDKEKEE